jgi:hypothetical protein
MRVFRLRFMFWIPVWQFVDITACFFNSSREIWKSKFQVHGSEISRFQVINFVFEFQSNIWSMAQNREVNMDGLDRQEINNTESGGNPKNWGSDFDRLNC